MTDRIKKRRDMALPIPSIIFGFYTQLFVIVFLLCLMLGNQLLTSSLKKHTLYNLLINNILYLCVT